MPEAVGSFIVEALVASELITLGVSEFAAGSFLGISGVEVIGAGAILGDAIGKEFAIDINHQDQTTA